nr:MAG TPA: hypothetical protein [Caudoviricetes sp.]
MYLHHISSFFCSFDRGQKPQKALLKHNCVIAVLFVLS